MDEPSLWCPSCGSEYRPGASRCADCRVALVTEEPTHLTGGNDVDDDDGDGDSLVEIGEWPKIQAQVLRRRLETASVPVMIEWTGSADDRRGVILVPEAQGEFAAAVVNEIDVDDEVSDDSPHAYVARIDEHLSAVAGLLDELRTRLDELESDGKL
ncbi:MAG TPA: hypothetical protein VGP92_13115 [Acidimicrobiia bacterium]|nr:hypothetical protein [Acidimicrobiia bacterium]